MTRVVVAVMSIALAVVGLSAGVATAAPSQPSVTLKASAHQVRPGTSVRLSGSVKRAHPRAVVRVQAKRADTAWRNVRTVRLDQRTKRFSTRVVVASGRTSLRVRVYPVARKSAAAHSRTIVITARRPAPKGDLAQRYPWASAVQLRILADTNDFRRRHGRAPLVLHRAVSAVATRWSTWMAEKNRFEHNPRASDQIPRGWTRFGENIAAGQQPTTVVRAWADSPGHRANMLGDFTHIGIGYHYVSGGSYHRFYTQNFAKY